jgi:hypothetical protein
LARIIAGDDGGGKEGGSGEHDHDHNHDDDAYDV